MLKLERGAHHIGIRELLHHNIIGTPGKSLVYQHQKSSQKLDYIPNPTFISLELGNKVVGTCCFVERSIGVGSVKMDGFYIRYFAFLNRFQSTGGSVGRLGKKSLLRDEVHELLTGKVFNNMRALFYAYIDPNNLRSKRLAESFGFEVVGHFKTLFFSRFRPKRDPSVYLLSLEEVGQVKNRISEFYNRFSLTTTENIGYNNGYYVYRQRGEIVAGIQGNDEHWKVHEIPGGKVLLNVLSRLPFLGRIFNKDFRFLSLEGVFWEEGHEDKLILLVESALALVGRNTAIICADPTSQLYQQFQKMDQGFIRFLTSEHQIAVVAKGTHDQLEKLKEYPVYVSGFDNM